MEFGLTWAKLDEMEYVTEAEKLGFTHLWVTDSGLIRSDAFVFLTVAAQQTRTMKLGMGVAVPGLRLAPMLAAGMATLNMIAPGRCFVGLGTGNAGMRLLGRKPLDSFEAYVRPGAKSSERQGCRVRAQGRQAHHPLHAGRQGLPQPARPHSDLSLRLWSRGAGARGRDRRRAHQSYPARRHAGPDAGEHRNGRGEKRPLAGR